eukprot:TRINITY_DN24589_c0_g1_i1.p1 TRINITY_DN24589_c0_g1~~TRINITY_DN24589_c0_g1_i1.p1  ORF type:complete len:135 (-),score=15.11 TRINITY_DN24589_c0_g1_i1:43-447(-)
MKRLNMASNPFYERSATPRAKGNTDLNLGDVIDDSPETKLKSALPKERFRSPEILFDSGDSEDREEEESIYPGEYLKTNIIKSPLQFRNQPISKITSNSSSEDEHTHKSSSLKSAEQKNIQKHCTVLVIKIKLE